MQNIETDFLTYKSLVDLYTSIAGISMGYINTCISKGMPKEETEKKLLEIDKLARGKVDSAYKFLMKMRDNG